MNNLQTALWQLTAYKCCTLLITFSCNVNIISFIFNIYKRFLYLPDKSFLFSVCSKFNLLHIFGSSNVFFKYKFLITVCMQLFNEIFFPSLIKKSYCTLNNAVRIQSTVIFHANPPYNLCRKLFMCTSDINLRLMRSHYRNIFSSSN